MLTRQEILLRLYEAVLSNPNITNDSATSDLMKTRLTRLASIITLA
jgi:hypothetical protein